MRTAPSPSASAWPSCCNRNGCASAAIGTRAAASPSTSSGRRARRWRACGCRIRAWRGIAGGGEGKPKRKPPDSDAGGACILDDPLGIFVHPAVLLVRHALFQSLGDDVAWITRYRPQIADTDVL